jgi:cysteine-rich secretory family protein
MLPALGAALLLLFLARPVFAQSVSPDAEEEILRLLNQERQSRGLPALASSEPLQSAARKHSKLMAEAHTIGHKLPGEHDLTRRIGWETQHFDVSGENVAVAPSAARAHAALMHSPGHRANILDSDYNSVGIGVVLRGGEVYVTQDFARLVEDASVEQIENKVAAELIRARQSAGEDGLRRIELPELRHQACEMAARDRLSPHAGMSTATSYRANSSVAFTAKDPAQIAGSLRGLRSQPARAFSVGACYSSSHSYENPVFWIVVVTYL